MEILRFIFSPQSLRVTALPPDDVPSAIPDWELLSSYSIPNHIAQRLEPSIARDVPRLGIICHAFNVSSDLLDELNSIFSSHEISSIVFTTDSHQKKAIIQAFLASIANQPQFTEIHIVKNLGRDVVPFWVALAAIAPHADVFLKLHWKKSPHLDYDNSQRDTRPSCNLWNHDLYSTLHLPDQKEIQELLMLFKTEKISCVFPRPWPRLWKLHWHSQSNLLHASDLLDQLHCPKIAMLIPLIFPAGNMFYGSVDFFRQFLDFFLAKKDYPCEPLPADGTVLHAIERIYTLLSASKGYNIATIFPIISGDTSEGTSCKRRAIVFPVADLMTSCESTRLVKESEYSLPYLYQTLMIEETQKLIRANDNLRHQLKLRRIRNYPQRIRMWLRKKLESNTRAKVPASYADL